MADDGPAVANSARVGFRTLIVDPREPLTSDGKGTGRTGYGEMDQKACRKYDEKCDGRCGEKPESSTHVRQRLAAGSDRHLR